MTSNLYILSKCVSDLFMVLKMENSNWKLSHQKFMFFDNVNFKPKFLAKS